MVSQFLSIGSSNVNIFIPKDLKLLLLFQIKKLQLFKNLKNAIFAKSAILAIFYFAPGGF